MELLLMEIMRKEAEVDTNEVLRHWTSLYIDSIEILGGCL